jgi:hypothetical protein
VSATATQSPPTRRCPRCAAPMAPEQDWCLECGMAVTTRVSRAPGLWVPVATVLLGLAIVGAIVVFAVNRASDDSDKAAGPAAAPARAPYRGTIPTWRSGTRAFTVVAFASRNRPAAEARARRLITAGQRAGVLRTTGYADFTPGLWIAWSGQYADSVTAIKSVGRVRALFPISRVRLIRKATPPAPGTPPPPTTSTPASTSPPAQAPAQ